MLDNLEENEGRIGFAKFTTPEDQTRILNKLKDGDDKDWINTPDISYSEVYGLSEEFFRQMKVARNKLTEMGMKDSSILLPTLEQVVLKYNQSWGWGSVSGACDEYGRNIMIRLDRSMSFPNELLDRAVYHETEHFLRKHIFKKGTKGNLKLDEASIETVGVGFVRNTSRGHKDLFEEATAELFALYCLNDDVVIATSYAEEVCFVAALLKKFADKKGVEGIEAFKKLVKANITRDFSFQRELVEVFGKEAVKEFNNFEWWEAKAVSVPEEERLHPEKLADLGGFREEYDNFKKAINEGQFVTLSGMRGAFRSYKFIKRYGDSIVPLSEYKVAA